MAPAAGLPSNTVLLLVFAKEGVVVVLGMAGAGGGRGEVEREEKMRKKKKIDAPRNPQLVCSVLFP